MPVSHSHQFLCVSLRFQLTRVIRLGLVGIGHVPDFVSLPAEGAQQIDLVGIALGQASCRRRREPSARRPARPSPPAPGTCARYFGCFGIGDVEDRGAVELGLPGQRIERLRHRLGAAVMADIGDVAIALFVDDRLVGAARLQIVEADEAHVLGFAADRRLSAPARMRAPPAMPRIRCIRAPAEKALSILILFLSEIIDHRDAHRTTVRDHYSVVALNLVSVTGPERSEGTREPVITAGGYWIPGSPLCGAPE